MKINVYRDKVRNLKLPDLEQSNFNKIKSFLDTGPIDDSLQGKKATAIAFSGGYDSTCLLIKRLEEGYDVYPFEIIFEEETTLTKLIILNILGKIYGNRLHRLITLHDASNVKHEFETKGFNQQPLCAFYSAFLPKNIINTVDKVEIAYVIGDAAISFMDNLKALYENAIVFKNYENTPLLEFPFSKRFHEDNVAYIHNYPVNLPCFAGDNVQLYICYKAKELEKYYVEITRCNENVKGLNKYGRHYSDYTVEFDFEPLWIPDEDEYKEELIEDTEICNIENNKNGNPLS